MSTRRSAPDGHQDGGFTLIEVILSVSIASLILVGMGYSITESFTNSTTTKRSVDRVTLNSITARYFSADIASSTSAPTPHTALNANPSCGPGKSLIDIPMGTTTIYYVVVGLSSGPNTLSRRTCNGPLTASQQQLGGTTDGFKVAPLGTTGAACNALNGVCSLTIAWKSPTSSFTVTGTRRLISG